MENYQKKTAGGGGFYLDRIESRLEELEHQLIVLKNETTLVKNILLEQSNNKLTQVFNTIYETNAWGYGSGSGSNENLCKGYVQFLQQFFQRNNIKSIVDIGCGDWQFSKNINFDGITYKGYDVASFIVDRNLAKYKKSNIDFIHYNGDFSVLPKADLAICKDVLQHLPNHNIRQFIDNLFKYKYVLIANDIGLAGENNDILLDVYAHRSLDLRAEPFNLPLEVVFEFIREPGEPNIAVICGKIQTLLNDDFCHQMIWCFIDIRKDGVAFCSCEIPLMESWAIFGYSCKAPISSLRDSMNIELWQSIMLNCFKDSITKVKFCKTMDCFAMLAKTRGEFS